MNLNNYLKAGYPGFYIETHEPLRAIQSLRTENWKSYSWDCQRGIIELDSGRITDDVIDPLGAVKWLGQRNDTVSYFSGRLDIEKQLY